jgi:hypothetical protein
VADLGNKVPFAVAPGTEWSERRLVLFLDEDHHRFGQNAIVLHGLGGSF